MIKITFTLLQVKFLIPNVAAGSIIGKGGAHISEIQTQSGARMQVCFVAIEYYLTFCIT
jgi:hypothetical protein